MNHWIFVYAPIDDEESQQIRSGHLSKKLKEGFWGIDSKTQYRQDLKSGDKALLYISGSKNKFFVASMELLSQLMDASTLKTKPDLVIGFPKFVSIKLLNSFKEPVSVYNIFGKLGFIKSKQKWGAYFQGGIRKIEKKDFETVEFAGKAK